MATFVPAMQTHSVEWVKRKSFFFVSHASSLKARKNLDTLVHAETLLDGLDRARRRGQMGKGQSAWPSYQLPIIEGRRLNLNCESVIIQSRFGMPPPGLLPRIIDAFGASTLVAHHPPGTSAAAAQVFLILQYIPSTNIATKDPR